MAKREIPSSVRSALEAYSERLRMRFGSRLKSVVLFGSVARGEANEDSDVDVLVLIDGLTGVETGEAAGEAAYVILETGHPISPVPMSTERWEALRGGERLFARTVEEEGIPL